MAHPTHRSLAFYQALPKVELHRHLEGGVRPATAWDLARRHGLFERLGSVESFQAARS